jgi:hypothetical protein
MSAYLDSLKADLSEAQKRFQEHQAEAQRVQQLFQAAHADLQALQRIVEKQTLKEQGPHKPETIQVGGSTQSARVPEVSDAVPDIQKTELIRETLRQHSGMTPAELYSVVKSHVARPYLYSVLKRLRDKEEVVVRRKKYHIKPTPKPEDGGVPGRVQ